MLMGDGSAEARSDCSRPPQTCWSLRYDWATQATDALVFTGSIRRTESFFIEITSHTPDSKAKGKRAAKTYLHE